MKPDPSSMSIVAVTVMAMLIGAAQARIHRQRRMATRRLAEPSGRRIVSFAQHLAPATLCAWAIALVERRRARDAAPADMLAQMLDDLARRCASGEALSSAFVTVTRSRDAVDRQLAGAATAIAAGATIDDALARCPVSHPDLALAIHVLRLSAQQGGTVAESLDRAAATLRDRHAMRHERAAQAAQARLSAKVLTVVPIAFAAWTVTTTASVRAFFTTAPGLLCLTLGVGLNATGWRLMQRAIRGAA